MYGVTKKGGSSCMAHGGRKGKSMRKRRGGSSCMAGGKKQKKSKTHKRGGAKKGKKVTRGKTMKKRKGQNKSLLHRLGLRF